MEAGTTIDPSRFRRKNGDERVKNDGSSPYGLLFGDDNPAEPEDHGSSATFRCRGVAIEVTVLREHEDGEGSYAEGKFRVIERQIHWLICLLLQEIILFVRFPCSERHNTGLSFLSLRQPE